MSWSYFRSGRACSVRKDAAAALARAADGCASVPAEQASVQAFAKAVDHACAAAGGQAVRVEGNGSTWAENGRIKGFNFSTKIEIIDLDD